MRIAILAGGFLFAMAFVPQVQAEEPDFDRAHVETSPSESRVAAEKEITEYISRLGEAVAAESVLRIVPMVDGEQTTEMVVSAIRNDRLAAAMRKAMDSRMVSQLAAGVSRSTMGWDRHHISKITVDDSLDLAVVTVRVWDQESYSNRIRFWTIRRPAGWKIYDFNELALGLRVTQIMLVTVGQVGRGATTVTDNDVKILKLAMYSLHGQDFETADQQLRILENRSFPALLESIRWALVAIVATALDDSERVLIALSHCDKNKQPFPIADYLRAVAYNQLGEPEKALAAADRFRKVFGDDAEALFERGLALEALERNDEAIAAYRQGLDDTPGSAENLAALGLLLPPDQKNEIATRFAVSPHPAARYDEIASAFLENEDMAALEALTGAMKKIDASDLNVPYYEAAAAMARDDNARAAIVLSNVLDRINDEEQRPYYIDLFLDASLKSKGVVAAYQHLPEKNYAFEYMASELTGEDRDDELLALIEAHRRGFPDDALTWYYTGEVHYYADEYEKADQAYAKASEFTDDEDYSLEIIRSRVYCWYMLDKGLDAFGKLKPNGIVFENLAELFFDDDRFDDLVTLIDRFEQAQGISGRSVFWRSRVYWSKQDYARCVEAVQPNIRLIIDELDEWDVSTVSLLTVRSLLRLDRAEETLPLLNMTAELDVDPILALLVNTSLGKVKEASNDLNECLNVGDWWPSELLDDEDLNRLLQAEQAAPVRSQLVRAFIDENRANGFVMLLKDPVDISADQIMQAANRVWGVKLILNDSSNPANPNDKHRLVDYGTGWFRIVMGERRFSVHVSEHPRCTYPATVAAEIRELRAHNRYKQHRAVLEVTLDEASTNEETWQMAARLLVELSQNTEPLLVEAPVSGHLAVWEDSLKQGMLGENPLQAVKSVRMVPVIRVDDDSPAIKKAIQTARERWSEFAKAFANRRDGEKFSVKASFTDGDHREAMWIKVTEVTKSEVRGTLDSKPVDVGTISYGDATSVSVDEILDWLMISADGKKLTGLFSREALQAVEGQ